MTNVLITGANGFLGSHVCEHVLATTDWNVTALCRVDYAGQMDNILPLLNGETRRRIRVVYHDLQFQICEHVAERLGKPDYILHLAAASHVDRSIKDPREFVMSNVVGTLNILEYARECCPTSIFLNFGTDECYGPGVGDTLFTEDTRHNPTNPYAATKVGQIALGMAYFKSYGLPVISSFCMNLYGERQINEKFVPKVVSLLSAGKPVEIHCDMDSNGHVAYVSRRHWLHAKDAADACIFLLKNGIAGERYNIAGVVELQNDELARKIAEIMGVENPDIRYIDGQSVRPGYDRQYRLDGSKLSGMGWKPGIGFADGLRDTVNHERDQCKVATVTH